MRAPLLALVLVLVAAPSHAAEYTLDPEHTFPSLEMPHMGISVWRGKFNRSSGRLTMDRAARTGNVTVEVDVASLDFGHDGMHEFAMKPDWLDPANHPTMTYEGTLRFDGGGDAPTAVDGELTLRGVTKPLKLAITKFGCIPHPLNGREICGADATGELERGDFGMTQYTENGMGRIRLEIQVEALNDAPAPDADRPDGTPR